MQDSFEELRPYLFAIAYRMLGSAADAEDIVQEAFLRWQRAPDAAQPKPYLSKVVTRLCIDHLRSARVRRETYVGPWLPEPLLTDTSDDLEAVERTDSLSMAFLVLLETLSPIERAVFLLREVFGYDYPDVAEVVGKSEANCRQIAHRAKEHVEARRPRFAAEKRKQQELMSAFFEASASGDLERLRSLLTEDAVLWSDGGGKVRAARRPIEGRDKVARFIVGIVSKAGEDLSIQVAEVNGQPGFVAFQSGRLGTVAALDVSDNGIHAVRVVANPDKLARLNQRTT